jgi:PAS domain S-box-containing protein
MKPDDTTLQDLRSLLEKSQNFAIYRLAVDAAHPYGGTVSMVSPSISDIIGISDPQDYGSWFRYVHPEDIRRVLAANQQAFETGTAFDESARIFNPRKNTWCWVRILTTPVVDESGTLTHFNGLLIDISQQKHAEERLRQQIEFEALVTSLSTRFINLKPHQIDGGINDALKTIGEFTNVDRCYVCHFSAGDNTMQVSHEWHAAAIASLQEIMPNLTQDKLPCLTGSIHRGQIVHLPQLDTLPADARLDRKELNSHGIQSLLLVPMMYQLQAIGFLGFDSVKAQKTWTDDSINLLKIVSELFVNALQQKRSQEEIAYAYQTLEARVAERTRELQVLLDFASATNSSLSLDSMLETALEQLVSLIDARRAAVMLRDSVTGQLEIRAYSPAGTAPPEELLKLNLAGGQVIETGKLAFMTSPAGESVLLPLRARGEVIGALGISGQPHNPFSEDYHPLFQSIADRLAIAVENALLYQQAEVNAAVTERNRLARDLHDAVTQTLFSASLIADVLPDIWQNAPEQGLKLLSEIRQLNRGALAEMRTLLLELRPQALQEAQLENLLHQLAEAGMGRLGVPVTVNIEGLCQLPPNVKIVMYRVAQEALNNIAKHAQATHVVINLFCFGGHSTAGKTSLKLEIVDNGRGFDPATVPPEHLGLRIMRERVESIGGKFAVTSQPGKGTRLTVTLKIADQ